MRFRLNPFIVVAIFPLHAFALSQDEFRKSIQHLTETQKSLDRQLSRYGISTPRSSSTRRVSGDETVDETESKKRTSLFQIHDDGKRLWAEAGKVLLGKVNQRLVVGGEGSPAVLTLSPYQGVFSGLRVLGKARPSGTEGRMAIDFDRVITREGKVIPIKGIAEDKDGAFGLEAQVFSSKAVAVAGSLASSFISGLAASQQSQTPNAFGFTQVERTGRNALLQGLAQSAADQSKRLIDESTKEKPVLVVEEGTQVILYLDEEVRF